MTYVNYPTANSASAQLAPAPEQGAAEAILIQLANLNAEANWIAEKLGGLFGEGNPEKSVHPQLAGAFGAIETELADLRSAIMCIQRYVARI